MRVISLDLQTRPAFPTLAASFLNFFHFQVYNCLKYVKQMTFIPRPYFRCDNLVSNHCCPQYLPIQKYWGRQRPGNKTRLESKGSKTGCREISGMARNESQLHVNLARTTGCISIPVSSSVSSFQFPFPAFPCARLFCDKKGWASTISRRKSYLINGLL